jgi:hypothetical protein
MESRLHDEYDRGYFEAWSDYMKILPKIEAPAPFNNNKNHNKQVPEETQTQEEATGAEEPSNEPKTADVAEPAETKQPPEKNAKPGQSLLLDYAK